MTQSTASQDDQPGGVGTSASRSSPKIPRPPLSLLVFMMAIGPFGDTEYTPAMPAMAHALRTDYGMVQFTMTAYLIGSALSRLYWGPLSDRFGRRPVMMGACAVLAAGLLLSLLSFTIWPLIGGRLIQGIGASAGGVIADAAVRDAFPADERQTIYAKLTAAFALAPAIGPVAGIYLAQALGWHANFGLLLALSVLLWLAVWRWMPETKLALVRHALEPRQLWRNYLRTLWTREFIFFAVLSGLAVGTVYTALIGAPDLVLTVLHRGSGGIVAVAVSILIAFVIGAGLCALLTGRVGDSWIVGTGIVIVLGGSAWLLLHALTVGTDGSLPGYLLPISACFTGVGLQVPVATAHALAPFKKTAGTAASMLGFVQMGVAALATVAVSVLHKGSVMDMPIVFLGLSGAAVGVFVLYLCWPRGLSGTPAAARPA